jgi:hypothetical protein
MLKEFFIDSFSFLALPPFPLNLPGEELRTLARGHDYFTAA